MQDPFLYSAIEQHAVPHGVFASKLATSGSELFMGGTKLYLYSGSIEYHSVVSDLYWTIGGGSVRVGGHTISAGLKTIIDSGTTLLVAGPSVVRGFYANVPESGFDETSGYHTFPCNATSNINIWKSTRSSTSRLF